MVKRVHVWLWVCGGGHINDFIQTDMKFSQSLVLLSRSCLRYVSHNQKRPNCKPRGCSFIKQQFKDKFADQSKILISKLGFDPGLTPRTLKKKTGVKTIFTISYSAKKRQAKQWSRKTETVCSCLTYSNNQKIFLFYCEIDLVFL